MTTFFRFSMLCVAFLCWGCSSQAAKEDNPKTAHAAPDTPTDTMEASLVSKGGSSLRGHVIVAQKEDRFTLTVNVHSGTPGSRYQVAFFDNGNCSSPNAFSAGKLWLPPETPADPATWIPRVSIDVGGSGSLIVRSLPNPQRHPIAVFKNKSVLIFDGKIAPLEPGVINDVIACGVFSVPKPFFD
ncbi:MAG: hypothetical protein LBG61_03830 [Burkholderiales bacterium]|jgi:hypothetical protein|nr:hypothetical protein [Burkholderiales bacterium]